MINQEPTYFNFGLGEDATKKNYFAMFPEEMIASFLESFVINKPMSGKVGGDGFWVYQDAADHLYIVLFDCMGHGHLASMMARVYTQSLQQVIESYQVKDPGNILRYLHSKIAAKFKDKDNLQVGTGADVGVLKINLSIREVEYAGAKVDLYHYKGKELELIKGNRMQVGEMFDYERSYETHSLTLQPNVKSNIYFASDGFKDLMGGPKAKKLGKTGVEDLLVENAGNPLMKQKEDINAYLENWNGSNMQLDDVLIIGIAI